MILMNNITKRYNNRIILNNVNLKIRDGEFIAILGSSGVGKSTLLNILGLIENYDSGNYNMFDIQIPNKSVNSLNKLRSEYIGFIYQLFYLIPNISVLDNIKLPLIYTNKNIENIDDKVSELTKDLNINGLLSEKIDHLSGGEKQRVAIARALISNPRIIICDEPTGNLDERNTEIVLDILNNEAKKGKTIILVTHSMKVAKKADKIYVIHDDGSLVINEKN